MLDFDMTHKLLILRYSDGGDSTLGLIYLNKIFQGYSLEDEGRSVKIAGETRIPEGRYRVQLRKTLSRLTRKYRAKYPWFKWHLQVMDVMNFDYVYIHIGNDDDDTEGCILVGDTANDNVSEVGFVGNSTKAFKDLYLKLVARIENDEEVYLEIKDLEKTL